MALRGLARALFDRCLALLSTPKSDLPEIAARPLKLLRNKLPRPPDPRAPAAPQQLDLFAAEAEAPLGPGNGGPTTVGNAREGLRGAVANGPPDIGSAMPHAGSPTHPLPSPVPAFSTGADPLLAAPQVPASNPVSAPPVAGPRPPAVPGQRRIQLDHLALTYQLRRSKRRTIGFMIDDDGLRITAPKWVGVGEIESAIREKQRWILAKLHEHQERVNRRLQPQMRWQDGGTLPYLGADLTLHVVAAASAGIRHDPVAQTLTVSLPADASEQQLKDRVQGWLQQEAKLLFAERLAIYADKLDVRFTAFALSSATTQWGSCTADGRIRLNWRLMHFALPLIDYVIAHELSHLREMNHGPRFWATVQSVFPEFVAAKKALRDHAPETLPAF